MRPAALAEAASLSAAAAAALGPAQQLSGSGNGSPGPRSLVARLQPLAAMTSAYQLVSAAHHLALDAALAQALRMALADMAATEAMREQRCGEGSTSAGVPCSVTLQADSAG